MLVTMTWHACYIFVLEQPNMVGSKFDRKLFSFQHENDGGDMCIRFYRQR